MKPAPLIAVTTSPVLFDLWGVNVPILSMFMGLLSVTLVRVMLMAKDFKNEKTYWVYNICLTVLMALITFAVIVDRQPGPGLSVMIGAGVGASGMVLVDILKERAESVVRALIGKEKQDEDA